MLMHGSTYSSHEFDVDYEDYSLVRRLAREGYTVWRLDIAGYGQSGEVKDGLMPDTAYVAEHPEHLRKFQDEVVRFLMGE